ncbi:phytanoyl-CoA dioxygenase family protein [Paenibacillus sp. strain BS8-2]
MTISAYQILEADASKQSVISDEQAQFFLDNGFLIVRNALAGEELKMVQDEMKQQYDKGIAGVDHDPDYMYSRGGKSGRSILKRIEYVIDKSDPMKVLLGHPFILKSVEKLQGPNFIPTWDSMVVKVPNEGAVVPWHRDWAVPEGCTDSRPIFNVDFYLDQADLKSCLWVIPGSNKWDKETCDERCSRPGFDTSDAIPVPMNPGDVIFHDIMVLHGSPEGDGNALRRTVYYEFRPGEIEAQWGPHTLEYLTLKQHVLKGCIEQRKQAPYSKDEVPYEYRPTEGFALAGHQQPTTFRYPHDHYWRV